MKRIVGSMAIPETAVYVSLREADGSRSGTIAFGRDQLSRLLAPLYRSDAKRARQIMKTAMRLRVPEIAAPLAIALPAAFVETFDGLVDLAGGSVIQQDIAIPPGGSMSFPPLRPSGPGVVLVHEFGGHVVALVPSKEAFRDLAEDRGWGKLPKFASSEAPLLRSDLADASDAPVFLLEGDVAQAACMVALRAFLMARQARRKSA